MNLLINILDNIARCLFMSIFVIKNDIKIGIH